MKKFLTKIKKLYVPFAESKALLYASAACYYTLISIPAASLTLLSLISRFPRLSAVLTLLPEPLLPIVEKYLDAISFSGKSILSLLIALWSAAKITASMSDGFRTIFSLPRTSYFQKRLRGILSLLATAAVIVAGTVVILLSCGFLSALFSSANVPLTDKSENLFMFPLLIFLLSLLYKYLSKCTPATAFISGTATSLVWTLTTKFFTVYLSRKTSLAGAILGAVLWLRWSAAIILYGAVFCRLLRDRSQGN